MAKLIIAFLIAFLLLSSYLYADEPNDPKIAIALFHFSTPPAPDLSYMVKSINIAITNRLNQYKNIILQTDDENIGIDSKELDSMLLLNKIELLRIRRETAYDGIIFGTLDEQDGKVLMNLNLIDLSSGKVYFSGIFDESFGSELLNKIEGKVNGFVNSIMTNYRNTLTVTSDPKDAEVSINGQKVGVTPIIDMKVNEGQIKVEIKKQGYVPYETSVDLISGQKGLINAKLSKFALSVVSNPSDASVLLNGMLIGMTPIENFALDSPEFTIEITKKGYSTFRQFYKLENGQQAFIYAELYGKMTARPRDGKSSWRINSHNISFSQTFDTQNMEEIRTDVFPFSSFQYYAGFNKLSIGFNIGFSVIQASQHFDTFLGVNEGYEPFDIDMAKGSVFIRYNILEASDWLAFYLKPFAGFMNITSNHPYAVYNSKIVEKTNPLLGGEIGVDILLAKPIKLSLLTGGYYAGQIEYAKKEASYWGEAKYRNVSLDFHPFYIGIALTLSINPF